jgi:hypothetical protein
MRMRTPRALQRVYTSPMPHHRGLPRPSQACDLLLPPGVGGGPLGADNGRWAGAGPGHTGADHNGVVLPPVARVACGAQGGGGLAAVTLDFGFYVVPLDPPGTMPDEHRRYQVRRGTAKGRGGGGEQQ